MAHVEPMDLDCIENDFDNKENTYQHNSVVPRVSTEKGYEELDVSDLNMKLRYSVTPAASPMSKSYTANCNDNKNINSVEDVLNVNNTNLTRSLNSTFTNSDSILKSPKSLPLQSISSDNFTDFNRNSSMRRSLDAPKNNVTVTITTLQDIEDNLSLPSTSSSLAHTPEATTPTKEIPKQDGGSPIMRGLKSVLSMFRTSQSPIPPVDDNTEKNVTQPPVEETSKQMVLASTPIRNKNSPAKSGSPLKDSVVFKDDLERELQWKDDSAIIFKEEKIPIHKLFLPSLPLGVKTNNLPNENMNNTVEYMDISLNESALNNQVENSVANIEAGCAESDSEFQDCETTLTKTEQDGSQLTAINVVNVGPEVTQENIDMSIVENEYHEVKDNQSVESNSDENTVGAIMQTIENLMPKDAQEGKKESYTKDMHQDFISTEKTLDLILPDVVENTLSKSVIEPDNNQKESNNAVALNNTENVETVDTLINDQTVELIKNKDVSIAETGMNIASNAELNNTNTIETKVQVAIETPEVKTFEIDKDDPNTTQVVHKQDNEEISIEKDNVGEIKADILKIIHKSEENTIEMPSRKDTQCLEESQCNMNLVHDEINDTSSMPLHIIANDVFINESNENKSDLMNIVQNESNIMNKKNDTAVDDNINMATDIENKNEANENQRSEFCQKKLNDIEASLYESLQPISSNIENSNIIRKSLEPLTDIKMPPADIPLPLENEDDKILDCNITVVKDTEENISESIVQQTIELTEDKDKVLDKLNNVPQNITVVASSDVIPLDNQIPVADDNDVNSSNDLLDDRKRDATLDKHDDNDVVDQITNKKVEDEETEILNVHNDKIVSENETDIEQIKNRSEQIAEQNQCDMEVENTLSKHIKEVSENKHIQNEVCNKHESQITIATSLDTTNKDEIDVAKNIDAAESVNDMDIDSNINPFSTKSRVLTTPPSSPKIVSKGYNFNFDEIDDPFATKTKIRESPTPISPPNNTFKPINDQGKRKSTNNNRKPIPNRRKSQPASKTVVGPNNRLNSTFDSSTFTKKSRDKLKSEEDRVDETNDEKEREGDQSSEENINQVTHKSENICTNKDEMCTVKETIQNKIEENDKFDSEDASSASDINIEASRKNVFNIPEIDDKNFNPFASRSKMCSSPIAENNITIKDNTCNMSVCDTTVNISNTKSENNVEKENQSDNSNITVSSKHTDKNDTVKEVNTEDEDTIEGPFLEPEDFVNFDKDTDILPPLDKDDMIGFDDFPVQANIEENGDNAEIFIDAEAFEFLLNQNKSNVVADSGKESLFLKFDPLFAKRVSSDGILAALNKPPKRVSTPKKTQITRPELQPDPFKAGPSSSKSLVASNYPDDVTVTKPTMIVNPAVNSIPSPRTASTPPKMNRQSLTFTSPAMAVIDRLLSLSGNSSITNHDTTVPHVSTDQHQTDLALSQLREMLAEKEIHVQTLRSEREELKDRLATMESQVKSLESESEDRLRKITELNQRLTEKTKENKTMAVVVEEYERTIASLVAELEQDKRRNAEECTRLIRDRDEQAAHLASMEVSFSDLHSKYEKSKQIIFSMKANEDTYKKSIKEFEENLIKMQNNYEMLKQHATSKLNYANSELEKMNRAHEAEVLKLNAMIKRKDLHITSLEETLAQKTKANEELTAICDELINKVG